MGTTEMMDKYNMTCGMMVCCDFQDENLQGKMILHRTKEVEQDVGFGTTVCIKNNGNVETHIETFSTVYVISNILKLSPKVSKNNLI